MPTSDVAGLFRVYAPDELGADGYPHAWHRVPNVNEALVEFLVGERVYGIKDIVRAAASHRCVRCHHPYRNGEHGNGEWSPCDSLCAHYDDGPIRIMLRGELQGHYQRYNGGLDVARAGWDEIAEAQIEAQWRILTVHHLNGDKADCRWWNLVPLCQRCHLTIQGRVVMERAFMLQHSEWFKPYAAGWYAWKYLGEDITREEAAARQDELLGLERLV